MRQSGFISMRGVSKEYPMGQETVSALRLIDLDISAAEKIAITGPSGSGKSSLMHLVGLLDTPSEGTYLLNGVDCETLTNTQKSTIRNERIGFIFQQFHLLSHLSMYQNVELPLLYAGQARREREDKIEVSLRQVGLWHRKDHKPSELSGGEQQRVAIARALVNLPSLLLADEPTGALDSANTHLILKLLLDLCTEHGVTLVVVTHDLQVAGKFDRQIRMRDGVVEFDTAKMAFPEA